MIWGYKIAKNSRTENKFGCPGANFFALNTKRSKMLVIEVTWFSF
jgi:hypothetical protein